MACKYCSDGCSRCDSYLRDRQVNVALDNFKLKSPIPDEVRDLDQLKNWFKKNNYVPYCGHQHDSQHTILRYINTVARMSPTLGGCIKSIRFCSFGGKFKIVNAVDPYFDLEEESKPVEGKLKRNFLNHINSFDLSGKNWNSIRASEFNQYARNGNGWLEVNVFKTLGVNKVKFIFHPTTEVLYKVPDLFDNVSIVAVSKRWDSGYLSKYPPVEIPVYPLYDEDKKKGIYKTMIHVKEGDNYFYGLPIWEDAMHHAFLEIKNVEYLLKAAHNMFTGKVIIEFEGDSANTNTGNQDAMKDGYMSDEELFAENLTNKGQNPVSALIVHRPMSAKEFKAHEFQINNNENYYEKVDNLTAKKIIMANSWSPKLLGADSTSGIGNNAFIDDLKTRMPIIEYYQGIIDGLINTGIKFANTILEIDDYEGIGIESKNPFDHLLKISEENNNKTPNTTKDVPGNDL